MPSSFLGRLLKITLLVKVVKQIKVYGGLWLHECVVALIKLLLNCFLISIGSDSEHLAPEAVILTVGETEDVGWSYKG